MSNNKKSFRGYVRTRRNWASAHTEELVSSALASILAAERAVHAAHREVCIAVKTVENLAREAGWREWELRYPLYDWSHDQYIRGGGMLAAVLRNGEDIIGYTDEGEELPAEQMARVAEFIEMHPEEVGAVFSAHDSFWATLCHHQELVDELWSVVGGNWTDIIGFPGVVLPWATHKRGTLDPGVL